MNAPITSLQLGNEAAAGKSPLRPFGSASVRKPVSEAIAMAAREDAEMTARAIGYATAPLDKARAAICVASRPSGRVSTIAPPPKCSRCLDTGMVLQSGRVVPCYCPAGKDQEK